MRSTTFAAAARAFLGGRVAGKRVIGIVGSGNNGGDAVGALRHLVNWGATVRAIVLMASTPLPEVQSERALKLCITAAIKQVAVAIRVAAVALLVGVALPLAAQAADTTPPSVPTGLKVTYYGSTQINLAWNASTDNVGVKGYYVYLNDVAIAVTTKPSWSRNG